MPRNTRHKAKRITVFNHKGGVGKTTLTVNVAAALGSLGKRVLLVDSDPQCNLTAYIVADDVVDDLLDSSGNSEGQTMWSAVKPILDMTGHFKDVAPIETPIQNVFLMPGDIKLSEFELAIGDYWTECFKRRVSGFKAVTAISNLVNSIAKSRQVDYVFYDTGPNIGPLNRVILLDSDYFIVPAACDLFSVRALNTLGQTLKNWILDWRTIVELAPDGVDLLPGNPQFLGYIPQRFRIYGGDMTQTSVDYLARFQKRVFSDVVSVLAQIAPPGRAGQRSARKLGEVKDFGTLVQLSQDQGIALSEVAGGPPEQREQARKAFLKIAENIVKNSHGP